MRIVVEHWGSAVFEAALAEFRYARRGAVPPARVADEVLVPFGALALEPCARLSREGLRRRSTAAGKRNGGRKPRKRWQS